MEGDHAVVQEVWLTLGDDLGSAVRRHHESGQLLQVRTDEIPNSILGAGCQSETLL
jgi:hypothetical protein